jgi:hypothetical protein
MKRRNGRTCWFDAADASQVREAIVEADKIAFDLTAHGDHYSVTLSPAPAGAPWWKGIWRCKTDASQGHLQAKLYTASDGGIVLVGIWKEDGEQYWFTELT